MALFWKCGPALASLLLLSSCGGDKELNLKEAMPPPGVGPRIRSSTDDGTPVASGGNVANAPVQQVPQDEIAWTNPDDPEAGIPEIDVLMAAPKKGPWEESETLARQIAAREGKPILIWFTDSARSPTCRIISSELFNDPGFAKWSEEHLIRLRVDANIVVDDPDLSLDEKITRQTEIRDYVKRLKKRYRVLGHPSVLLLNPSGEVIARYRGYQRGDKDYFWGLIRQGVASSEAQYTDWRKSMEAKGYRDWQGKSGRKVFAKLASYSKGSLVLVEPGGERFRTHEDNLSRSDRKWIDEQKAMRGIQ